MFLVSSVLGCPPNKFVKKPVDSEKFACNNLKMVQENVGLS